MSNRASLFTKTLVATCAWAAIAACGGPPAPETAATPPPPASSAPTAPKPSSFDESAVKRGPMLNVSSSKFGDKLKAVGLDVKQLPKLETIDKGKIRDVMKVISEATGASCTDCHGSETDFTEDTPRKRVAKRMWNEWVLTSTMANGDPIFCDSCHHGTPVFLEHSASLGKWMEANFVKGLARKDKRDRRCADCHGEPFNQYFIEDWKSGAQ